MWKKLQWTWGPIVYPLDDYSHIAQAKKIWYRTSWVSWSSLIFVGEQTPFFSPIAYTLNIELVYFSNQHLWLSSPLTYLYIENIFVSIFSSYSHLVLHFIFWCGVCKFLIRYLTIFHGSSKLLSNGGCYRLVTFHEHFTILLFPDEQKIM